jgi:uncharacterized SAM-binding protein YcdF (DUF218 family)
MSLSLIALIKTIILPPSFNFILITIGLCFKQNKILSRIFLYSGSLTLLLFCTPSFSDYLLKGLEKYPALIPPVVVNKEQAIVVLGGGTDLKRKEFGREIDGTGTLQRIHYTAFLYRQVNLPILVTGGILNSHITSEASVMSTTLVDSFNIKVKWKEDRSRNTAENAIYSAAILKENEIDSIYLVTHASHMPRAVMMFEKEGINTTPAPTIFTADVMTPGWPNYIPSLSALLKTRKALHEYTGIIWYKLRYI